MDRERNFNALADLLEETKSKIVDEKPLWRFIYEQLDEMEASKCNGLTYKAMASRVGVSLTAFNNARKKASEFKRVELAKTESVQKDDNATQQPLVKKIKPALLNANTEPSGLITHY